MKKTDDFQADIVKAMKQAGKYAKSLQPQIMSLAGALRTIELANRELDDLDSTVTPVINRYGCEGFAPHPVFKILRDAQDSVTRQMKALGLTAGDLEGQDDNDPLIELTKKVKKAARKVPPVKRAEAVAADGRDEP